MAGIGNGEVQCMDCLRKWPRKKGFKADWGYDPEPDFDER
jgi:hypothetical protein